MRVLVAILVENTRRVGTLLAALIHWNIAMGWNLEIYPEWDSKMESALKNSAAQTDFVKTKKSKEAVKNERISSFESKPSVVLDISDTSTDF
ncbi:hypothetical protein TNCV_3948021 [Trichonephila clavipes]|nr:hypothetical protein TNCV_3948021 [Trichonephila clavipes]